MCSQSVSALFCAVTGVGTAVVRVESAVEYFRLFIINRLELLSSDSFDRTVEHLLSVFLPRYERTRL